MVMLWDALGTLGFQICREGRPSASRDISRRNAIPLLFKEYLRMD